MMPTIAESFERLLPTMPTTGTLTRRLAVLIADEVGLSPLRAVEELERIGKCRPGSALWFRINGGFTVSHAKTAMVDAGRKYPPKWIARLPRAKKRSAASAFENIRQRQSRPAARVFTGAVWPKE